MKDVSLSQFADKLGISRAGVTYWRRRGIFKKAIKTVPGKKRILLDYKKALAAYKKNVDPAYNRRGQVKKSTQKKIDGNGIRPKKKKKSGDKTFADARAETEKYKALNAQLKYEIELKKWVPRDLVRDEIYRASRICRDTFVNLPTRLAPLMASQSSEQKIFKILHEEIQGTIKQFLKRLHQVANK